MFQQITLVPIGWASPILRTRLVETKAVPGGPDAPQPRDNGTAFLSAILEKASKCYTRRHRLTCSIGKEQTF